MAHTLEQFVLEGSSCDRSIEERADSPGPIQPPKRVLCADALGDFRRQFLVGRLEIRRSLPHFFFETFPRDKQRFFVAPLTAGQPADKRPGKKEDRKFRNLAQREADRIPRLREGELDGENRQQR